MANEDYLVYGADAIRKYSRDLMGGRCEAPLPEGFTKKAVDKKAFWDIYELALQHAEMIARNGYI